MTAPVSNIPFPVPAATKASGPGEAKAPASATLRAPGAPVRARSEKGDLTDSVFASVLAGMAAQPHPMQSLMSALPVGDGKAQSAGFSTPAGIGLPTAQVAWPPVPVLLNGPAPESPLPAESALAPSLGQSLAEATAAMAVVAEAPDGQQSGGAEPQGQGGIPLPDLGADLQAVVVEESSAESLTTPAGADKQAPSLPVLTAPGGAHLAPASRGEMPQNPVAQAAPQAPETPPTQPEQGLQGLQPDQPAEPAPEIPVTAPAAEPIEPLSPVQSQPVQPATVDQVQPDLPVEQTRPLPGPSVRYGPRQLIDELARTVSTLEDGQYSLTLRLHPEHLGEVRLQIQMNGRQVHTAMEVANHDARQLLENRSDQLRQNLDQAGLTLSGFEVNTGQQRQSLRERREAFADALSAGGRRVQPTGSGPTATAVNRNRSSDRRGGRLDTMA